MRGRELKTLLRRPVVGAERDVISSRGVHPDIDVAAGEGVRHQDTGRRRPMVRLTFLPRPVASSC